MTARSDVIAALVTARPQDLLGLAENVWLDFKSAPYAFATDRNRFELCKDVAALANTQGGLLVLGVKAETKKTEAIEVATELSPFPKSAVKLDAYIDTLNNHLWPRTAVEFRWYEAPEEIAGPDRFFLVIEVEPAPEADRYIIVRRVLDERDKLVDGFAVPQRVGDRTPSLPSLEIYRLINDGLRSRTPAPTPPLTQGQVDGTANKMIDDLERVLDWNDKPVLLWQSLPQNPPSILPDLHSPSGMRGALDHQNVLRSSGFNFQSLTERPRVHEGGLLISRNRCAIAVDPQGLITAGAVADPSMLCRGSYETNPRQRISPFVLTELTLEYFRLADNVVLPKVPGPWQHRIVARRFKSEETTLTLPPGIDLANTFASDALPASRSFWDRSWAAIGDPERDAYEALCQIYALFGIDIATNTLVVGDRVPLTGFTE